MSDPNAPKTIVRLWDIPVRLFHWALVAAIVTAWWSNEEIMIDLHALTGYTVLALVLFRVLWGFFGSSNAQFRAFLKRPGRVLGYLRKMPKGSEAELACPGHNPAGGWMVAVLLLLVAIQAITGLFASEDTFLFFYGPMVAHVSPDFADFMNRVHHINIKLIYVAVGLHVCAALFYLVFKRENLIGAMITGKRSIPLEVVGRFTAIRFKSPLLAIVLFAICAGAVWFLINWARGAFGA